MKRMIVALVFLGLAPAAMAEYEVIDVKLTAKGISQQGKSSHYKYETERLSGFLITHEDTNGVESCWFVLYGKHHYTKMKCSFEVQGYPQDKDETKGLFVAELKVEPLDGDSDLSLNFEALVIGKWRDTSKGSSVNGKGAALMEIEEKDIFASAGYSKNVNIRLNRTLTSKMNEAEYPELYLEEQVARRARMKVERVNISLHD